MNIKCLYSCSVCGIKAKELEVKQRGKAQSVGDWLNEITVLIGLNHGLTSPQCPSKTFNLRLPVVNHAESPTPEYSDEGDVPESSISLLPDSPDRQTFGNVPH